MIPVVTLFAKSAKAVVWSRSWNRYFVRLIVPEILRCIDFGVWAWNCLFMPLFGVFFSIFPHMTLPIAMTPQRTFLWPKHVVWAIQRKNLCDGSTWARAREKIQDNKSHNVLYSVWGKPPLDRFDPKVAYNHVCQVSHWNLYGLRYYRGSNFRFSYWFLYGPFNNAALPVIGAKWRPCGPKTTFGQLSKRNIGMLLYDQSGR